MPGSTHPCTSSSATSPPWTLPLLLAQSPKCWPACGSRQDHQLWWLCDPALCFPLARGHRVHPVGGDGIWPLSLTCADPCTTPALNPQLHWLLAAIAWLGGLALTFGPVNIPLSLCGHRRVDSFLWGACYDQTGMCWHASQWGCAQQRLHVLHCCPAGVILISYCCQAQAVLKIRSAEGRRKAFNTCLSHFGGGHSSSTLSYLGNSASSQDQQAGPGQIHLPLLLCGHTHEVNPLIYTLRNRGGEGSAEERLLGKGRDQAEEENAFIIYHLFISTCFFSFSLWPGEHKEY